MQADQVIWFVAGGITVLVFVLVIRLFRQPQDDSVAPPSTAGEQQPPSPIRFSGQVPYGVDNRPMPTGDNPDVLLPAQVGPFVRERLDIPPNIQTNSIYAGYRKGDSTVFVELGICGTPSGSQRAMMNAKGETDAEFPDVPQQCVLKADPSFLRTVNKLGAFFAWTRGGYYFSAHAKKGEADLDAFVRAFPY